MTVSAYLFDSNVWVALSLASHSHHREAKEALARASASRPALFCRATQLSFLRLTTTPVIMRNYGIKSFTNRDALATLNQFLAIPAVGYREEPSGVAPFWLRWAASPKPSPHIWMDAYLAAFAMAGGFRLVTMDKGFKQFKGLDVRVLAKT